MNATRTVGLALLAAAVLACGRRDAPDPADPWPLSLREPTVLGYAVLCVPPDVRDDVLQEALGWTPAGLASDRPIALVRFDSSTFAGPAAVLFPVEDGRAFLDSLRGSPGIEALDETRFAFRPPLHSALGAILMLASGWEMRSPMDVLATLGSASGLEFVMDVHLEDGHALAVPSFEALAVCRGFLAEVSGLADARPTEAVLSMDLDQLRIVYAEQIRAAEQQLQALLTGARLAIPFALMRAGMEEDTPVASINWELVWALRDMLDLDSVDALQLHVAATPDTGDRADGSIDALLESISSARVRVRIEPDAVVQPVLSSLRPVPDGLDALVLLAADPDRFAPAFAAWCRPLADFAKGEGAPSDRWLEELADLLSAWDGLLGVFGTGSGPEPPVLLATVRDDGLDPAAVLEWLGPLLVAAGVDDVPSVARVEQTDDGRRLLRDAAGDVAFTTGRQGPVQWLAAGDASAPPADMLIRFAGRTADPGAPGLRCVLDGARLELRHDATQTLVELALPGAD